MRTTPGSFTEVARSDVTVAAARGTSHGTSCRFSYRAPSSPRETAASAQLIGIDPHTHYSPFLA